MSIGSGGDGGDGGGAPPATGRENGAHTGVGAALAASPADASLSGSDGRIACLVINRRDRTDRRAWMAVGVAALRAGGRAARFIEASDRLRVEHVPSNDGARYVLDGVEFRSYVPADAATGAPLTHEETIQCLARDLDMLGAPQPVC